jgi:hypothetical protein
LPRRDTNSAFNRTFGGRVFPGIFSRARFETSESANSVAVRIVRADGGTEVAFAGRLSSTLPPDSVFPTLGAAAGFFSLGATGYSATNDPARFHGMELHSLNWSVAPLAVDEAHSAFFDATDRFPPGSAVLDCALLMRGIEHEWHSRPDLHVALDGLSFTTSRATGGAAQISEATDVTPQLGVIKPSVLYGSNACDRRFKCWRWFPAPPARLLLLKSPSQGLPGNCDRFSAPDPSRSTFQCPNGSQCCSATISEQSCAPTAILVRGDTSSAGRTSSWDPSRALGRSAVLIHQTRHF